MKKFGFVLLLFASSGFLSQSCDDSETYAEKKAEERGWIKSYIEKNNINVISGSDFKIDTITDVAGNEYVYFDDSGVYMQIVERGEGEMMKDGDHFEIIMRFIEVLVETGDTLSTTNKYNPGAYDVMMCSKSSGSFTASFTEGNMYSNYGSSVPTGWLIPLNYIKLQAQLPNEHSPKVRLIVPHSAGHSTASSYVTPYFYEITYQKKR